MMSIKKNNSIRMIGIKTRYKKYVWHDVWHDVSINCITHRVGYSRYVWDNKKNVVLLSR